MGKTNKNLDNRIKYKVSDFFVDKLQFKDNTLYFGSNNKLVDVSKLINFQLFKARKFLNLKTKDNNFVLNDNQIAELAFAKGIDFVKVDDVSEFNILQKINYLLKDKFKNNPEVEWCERPPIVTIMGHVDHGKTTLLDTIRKSNLTKKEVGGITQSIGAYQIKYDNKLITFIDTPGHEAFSKMRAQGSKLTDIVILVVAADDSIMPQTKESIDHAREAGVPIIVAINKVDKHGVNIDKVRQELTSYDIVPLEWGGKTPFIEISALKNLNIDKLLIAIIDMAKGLDLKVPLNILGSGTIIEANISKSRGNLINAIVLNGKIRISDKILIDDQYLRIKALISEEGKTIKEAGPGTPVEIYGLGFSPEVGTNFVVSYDKGTEKISQELQNAKKNFINANQKIIDPFLIFQNSALLNKKVIKIILKANSLGMLIALADQIEGYSNDEVEVKIIRKDVGPISNTDISLAETAGAFIYQFSLKTPSVLLKAIKLKKIQVESFDIIYKLLEDIEEKIAKQKPAKFRQEKIGEAEILQRFLISKLGYVAGSKIVSGKITIDSYVKIYRKNKFIEEQKISSLKIMKNNVKIVKKDQECGIMFENFDNFEVEDRLEIFELIKE